MVVSVETSFTFRNILGLKRIREKEEMLLWMVDSSSDPEE